MGCKWFSIKFRFIRFWVDRMWFGGRQKSKNVICLIEKDGGTAKTPLEKAKVKRKMDWEGL